MIDDHKKGSVFAEPFFIFSTMKNLATFLFLLISCLSFGQVEFADGDQIMELTFLEDSQLIIEVETNVNEFDCHYTHSSVFSNLCFQGERNNLKVFFSEAELRLPIDQFDCGGKLINRDFVDLLYREDQPFIEVNFKSAKWYSPEQQIKNRRLGRPVGYFEVEITLAGEARAKTLQIFSSDLRDNKLFSQGSITLNMKEFGIDPPEKFMGMVKVKELLIINFDLNIMRI